MTPRCPSFRRALLAAALLTGCAGSDDPSDAASIDLRVVFDDTDASRQALFRLEDRAQHAGTVDADGIVAIDAAPVELTTTSGTLTTCAATTNIPTARRFHPDPAATGLADAATLSEGHVLIDRFHANALDASDGTEIEVTAADAATTVEVDGVVDDISVAGYCGIIMANADFPDDHESHLLISLRDPDDPTSAPRSRAAVDGFLHDVGRPDLSADASSEWDHHDPVSG